MLNWCCYCQQFQGEVPPYDRFDSTHGCCAPCVALAMDPTESDLAHARILARLQAGLRKAGQSGDLAAAGHLIEEASADHVRAVDVLMGIVAPLLAQIGKDWERGFITVAEGHQFIAFSEALVELVTTTRFQDRPADARPLDRPDALLMTADGNRHTLAVGILSLWLMDSGMRTRVLDPGLPLKDLLARIGHDRPRLLLISMALAEQRPGVVTLVECLAALPEPVRPRVIVGGYAVKLGHVDAIPGAELMVDISGLRLL